MPTITPITAFPAKNSATFKTRVESFFQTELPTAITEINAAIDAFNTNDLYGTSTTSFTPNVLGSKTFVTQSGKSWLPGQWVTVGYTSDGREFAAGPVQSYSGTSLQIDIQLVSGHVTARTSWQIAFSPPLTDLIGDRELVLHSGNGYGSTNTKYRRWSTVFRNTLGSDITYADDVANGGKITINASGNYFIERKEGATTSTFGVGRNCPASTTLNFPSTLAFDDILIRDGGATSVKDRTINWLSAGDELRAWDGGTLSTDTSDSSYLILRRLS